MMWNRPEKDHYRWRYCFALFPHRIGGRRVWLGKYAWRYLPPDQTPKVICLPGERVWWEEHVALDGFAKLKRTAHFLSLPVSSVSWYDKKPNLKVVGG